MTTVLFTLAVSLALSLVLTHVAREAGKWCGAMDKPDDRKVHDHPIPRTGGMAIFVSFFLALLAVSFLDTSVSAELALNRKILFVVAGAAICFIMGVVDDCVGVKASIKLLFQILAASVAYAGGVHISTIAIGDWAIHFEVLDYAVTVFWFLLFMNAVNLVDGLDGLAGGIVVFSSLVMIVLSIMKEEFFTAIVFTALAGSVLGFLRYNFNPASIFMGDSGSYFLGYVIAAMGILGAVKSQVAPAMLIPLLALGVPIFDTILSPVRRFMRGRAIFSPDNRHIHHRLQKMGLSTRSVVWILYGVTVGLCLLAMMVVHIRDERAGFFLILLGIGALVFIRKLGYFEYLGTDKIMGWFRDLTDDSGLSTRRRSFLNYQIEVSRAENRQHLWDQLTEAGRYLNLDRMELKLNHGDGSAGEKADGNGFDRFVYSHNGFNPDAFDESRTLKVLLPLSRPDRAFGSLTVYKDLRKGNMSPLILRRIEQVRRSVIDALDKID